MPQVKHVFVIVAFALVGFANPVMAHSPLKNSSIQDGAVLEKAPATLSITFAGKVGLAALIIKDSTGEILNKGQKFPRSMQTSFHITLPTLKSGAYKAEWRTMSSDGHIMTGQIGFSIK